MADINEFLPSGLSVGQAAKQIGVTGMTIRLWVTTGVLIRGVRV